MRQGSAAGSDVSHSDLMNPKGYDVEFATSGVHWFRNEGPTANNGTPPPVDQNPEPSQHEALHNGQQSQQSNEPAFSEWCAGGPNFNSGANTPNLQVDSISAFKGIFPASIGPPNAGQQAVNPNGNSSAQAYGFNLSVGYTLMNGNTPMSNITVSEEFSVEADTIVSNNGQLEIGTARTSFSGQVAAPTDARGAFTDAPIGVSSDTPITSATITQTMYIGGSDGSRRVLATNTIKATVDMKIVNNKIVGTGKIIVSFSNSSTHRTVQLGPPTRVD